MTTVDDVPSDKKKVLKVDRSAAAIAMADLRRAARVKTGPGPREMLELRQRVLERTGGSIEEDISGESRQIMRKAEDFQQSCAGDQRFASESNSSVVQLQRALWYVDSLMRGTTIDKIRNVQDQRVEAAKKRLASCIRAVEHYGVQRPLVMRANWVLSRFQKWGDNYRKERREKRIEKLQTIIPDDWMKKSITRNYKVIEKDVERNSEVTNALSNLSQLIKTNKEDGSDRSSDLSSDSDSDSDSDLDIDKYANEEQKKKLNIYANDGNTMSKEAQSTVDAIVMRRAARKKFEKKQRKQKRKQKLTTLRTAESLAKIEHHAIKISRRLHRSMAHVVARPVTPEERWTADMYEEYEEYDRTVNINRYGGGHDFNTTFNDTDNDTDNEHDDNEHDDKLLETDSQASEMSVSSTSTSDSIPIVKKTKIFSKDEMMAMRAETDFGEDVATFLDGSGLVKNTGPAARVKFVRMMKTSYLDIRTKRLKRTKRVIAIIKKIKQMLRRVLLMPTDDDVVQITNAAAKAAAAKAAKDEDPNTEDIDPDDIDALLEAQSVGVEVKREGDIDIFKRWAGRKIVELEPLLCAKKTSASSSSMNDDDGNEPNNSKWVCKVCMQTNDENALICMVCGRPPNAPATSWGLAKHRPRRTHPRFMHTFNQKIGKTIRQWEQQEQMKIIERKRSGRTITMSEELKEKFYLRSVNGGVLIP